MAASAGVADVTGIDAAGGVGVLEDFVFAVAICAQWRLGHAARQGLAVHAGAELFDNVGVAHAAGIWDRGAEGLRFRSEQFVRAAVAQGAIGRTLIAALTGLAVDALIVIAGLICVAGEAGGLRNIGGVRNFFVRLVAGVAREICVRALGEFLPLLVAGCALRDGVIGGIQVGAGNAGKQA